MKIPEYEMFIGQVWGTLIGPFVNYGMMSELISAPRTHEDHAKAAQDSSSTLKDQSLSKPSFLQHGMLC
jgi:hypothetical protein